MTIIWKLVAFAVVFFGGSDANISGTEPPQGQCLCVTHWGVRVRDPACGTQVGSANTGECFTYLGPARQTCQLSGTWYDFYRVDYHGRDGWMAGNFLEYAESSRCGGGGGSGGYHCPLTDGGRRIHEMTSPTRFDCRDYGCGNTCQGGQCVAYITCRCTRQSTGHHPPGTSCWRPGAKVVSADGRCNRNIASGTAIATFNAQGRYYAGHAAVFVGCDDDYTIRTWDQWCCRSIGYTTYIGTHSHYDNYYVIENPGICSDRVSWPCRSEAAGATCCPTSVSGCLRQRHWAEVVSE